MLRAAIVAAGLIGCYSPHPQTGSSCTDGPCPSGLVCSPSTLTCELTAGDRDAGLDGPGAPDDAVDGAIVPDVPPGFACRGTGMLQLCLQQPPAADLQISQALTIDTDASTLCQAVMVSPAQNACVLVGNAIRFDAGVRVVGSRPLIVVAFGLLEINNVLDVSSHASSPGAAADPACMPGQMAAGPNGGPGGSFGTMGGAGAISVAAGPPIAPTTLRGGCHGGRAAAADNGGHGGGAVYLIAGTDLRISGVINASGEGGHGAVIGANGGGGGGSGGMIVLDGAPITMNLGSEVYANGGGGGEGGGLSFGGAAGGDPVSWNAIAAGGTTSSFGGDGGGGYANGTTATGGATVSAGTGNGGGGGGAGVIRVYGLVGGATNISPPPS